MDAARIRREQAATLVPPHTPQANAGTKRKDRPKKPDPMGSSASTTTSTVASSEKNTPDPKHVKVAVSPKVLFETPGGGPVAASCREAGGQLSINSA